LQSIPIKSRAVMNTVLWNLANAHFIVESWNSRLPSPMHSILPIEIAVPSIVNNKQSIFARNGVFKELQLLLQGRVGLKGSILKVLTGSNPKSFENTACNPSIAQFKSRSPSSQYSRSTLTPRYG